MSFDFSARRGIHWKTQDAELWTGILIMSRADIEIKSFHCLCAQGETDREKTTHGRESLRVSLKQIRHIFRTIPELHLLQEV